MSVEVLEGQQWLNSTYGSHPDYPHVEETGLPGSAMSAALVSAMQIELGVSPVTGVFAELTKGECDAHPLSVGDDGNRVRIMHYGLYSKGYNPFATNDRFTTSTEVAALTIQQDAGLSSNQTSALIRGRQMQAILGVDEYKLVAGGDPRIRALQQDLNRRYLDHTGLKACDGHYSRSTNQALMFAFQAEEGMPTSMATGAFGPSTRSYCPDINVGSPQYGMNGVYGPAAMADFIKLAQYALYCLGRSPYKTWVGSGSDYDPGPFDGQWSPSTVAALNDFQAAVGLPVKNWMGLDDWMGLMVSTGNPDRHGAACDCSTQILSTAMVQALVYDEYEIVGRYLTGSVGNGAGKRDKNLTREEIDIIFDAGLRLFCIFQDDEDWLRDHDNLSGYFGYDRGYRDARKAVQAAVALGVPETEYIYFAVDYDFMEGEVWERIIPHFQGIADYMADSRSGYQVGIYSARNTCGIVSTQGLASSSFVGDMSTGYSGNIGYPLPPNWAFDQVKEYVSLAGFKIDKNIPSGRYDGFDHIEQSAVPGGYPVVVDIDYFNSLTRSYVSMSDVSWNDGWFASSAHNYHHKMATAAIALSALAYSSPSRISNGFQKLGFARGDIRTVTGRTGSPIGATFASKKIVVGGSEKDLVVVAVRGTANGAEWESNMNISDGGSSAIIHSGFSGATTVVTESLNDYLDAKSISLSGTTKLLITGHSRGAAVGNLLAANLLSSNALPSSSMHTYLFATPNVSTSVTSASNIHNIVNIEDFVPRVPLAQWGFDKHGEVLHLPSISNRTLSEYNLLHDAMNVYFTGLCGMNHNYYLGGATSVLAFLADVYNRASDVVEYYNTKHGSLQITVHDFFMQLAEFMGDENIHNLVDLVADLFYAFPDLVDYFSEEAILHLVFHAHCPETYLSWMQSQDTATALFG